jgi:hypothetical protein
LSIAWWDLHIGTRFNVYLASGWLDMIGVFVYGSWNLFGFGVDFTIWPYIDFSCNFLDLVLTQGQKSLHVDTFDKCSHLEYTSIHIILMPLGSSISNSAKVRIVNRRSYRFMLCSSKDFSITKMVSSNMFLYSLEWQLKRNWSFKQQRKICVWLLLEPLKLTISMVSLSKCGALQIPLGLKRSCFCSYTFHFSLHFLVTCLSFIGFPFFIISSYWLAW